MSDRSPDASPSAASETAASQDVPSDALHTPEATAPTARPFAAGLELAGRYRLLAPIGKGGMGEVWEAEHVLLRRKVAVKLLLPNRIARDTAARLRREAELAASLDHPNIVAVTDFGELGPGQPFVVMERLTGRSLSALLRERAPLSWTEARDIGVQIAAGLARAHEVGIIHRDLKPSNVFVLDDPHGHLRVKIIDFGLAKTIELEPGDRALTKSGSVFGTPGYMAPEQIRGEKLDARADIYALGAMLYEMLVGEPLWRRGPMVQVLYSHLFEPAPTIRTQRPEIPGEFDVLVAACLCKDRQVRPADAAAVRLALLGVGTGKGSTIAPVDHIPTPAPEIRARYAMAAPSGPPRWAVPVGVAAIASVAIAVALRFGPRVLAPAHDDPPTMYDPTPATMPAHEVAAPAVPITSPPAKPSVPTPAEPAATPTTPEPARATAATRTQRSRRTAKPAATKPEPTPPPRSTPPPVPKRKGDTLPWPSEPPGH